MKIQIAGLSEGIHEYQFREPVSELGLDSPFADDIEVRVTLDRTGTQFHLRAGLTVPGAFICDRCTAPFRTSLVSSYRMHYVASEADAESLDPTEVQVISPTSSVIDLVEDVRQTAILSVPFKLLCREECKGLCPRCGTDWNTGTCACEEIDTDSRWEKLRGIRPDSM